MHIRLSGLVILAIACSACAQPPEFDLLVTGGTVFDGTGIEPRRIDLGIKGDRIVAIGEKDRNRLFIGGEEATQ